MTISWLTRILRLWRCEWFLSRYALSNVIKDTTYSLPRGQLLLWPSKPDQKGANFPPHALHLITSSADLKYLTSHLTKLRCNFSVKDQPDNLWERMFRLPSWCGQIVQTSSLLRGPTAGSRKECKSSILKCQFSNEVAQSCATQVGCS